MNGIKEIRLVKGLTQEEFAQRLGVSKNTINRWEKGHNRPRSKIVLAKIKRVLGLTAQALADLMKEAE